MEYIIKPRIDNSLLGSLMNQDLEPYINNGKCIKNSEEFPYYFVCFNFALNNKNILSCEQALTELECNYTQVSIKEAKQDDIISYHEDTGMIYRNQKPMYRVNHFAIITETDGTIEGTIIESKWGSDGVFKSTIDNVPDTYGNIIGIWRK